MRGLVAVLLAGCTYAPGTDTSPTGEDSALVGDVCLGSGTFVVCVPVAPTNPDMLAGTIDTDTDCTHVVTPATGPALCVRTGTQLSSSSPVKVLGSRPLVLFATGDLEIANLLDAGSHRAGGIGPNANPAECTPGTAAGADTNGGGGGAGGSFATAGGDGGRGDGGSTGQGQAAAEISSQPTFLRGGCDGGHGGAGGGNATGGLAGKGGGAVSLLAGGTLRISGQINVSGAGGTASPMPGNGDNGGGAGGGGSGGMLVLFAVTTIDASGARVMANGGGGAEGGDKPNNCDPGDDPTFASGSVGGLGGSGICGAGGDGGDGDPSTTKDGSEGSEGGGGGGGGLGVILSSHPLPGAQVSPPASL